MDLLFKKGKSITSFPIKVVFTQTKNDIPFSAQALFVVPKKNFKKAHDRNLLKRRMNEVYRVEKKTFYQQLMVKEKKLLLAFIFTGKKEEEYEVIRAAVMTLLKKMDQKL